MRPEGGKDVRRPGEIYCRTDCPSAYRGALFIQANTAWLENAWVENDGTGEKNATLVKTITTTRSQKLYWPTTLKIADAAFGCSRSPDRNSGRGSP